MKIMRGKINIKKINFKNTVRKRNQIYNQQQLYVGERG